MLFSASLGAIACGGNSAVAQNTAPKAPAPPPAGHAHHQGGDPALLEAVEACIARGEACLAHCLAMLAGGDTTMGTCAKAVYEMKAVMAGVAAAAASGSRHLAALTKVAAEFCKDCEAECRKHADKHAVCKECLDACTKSVAALQKAAG